MTREVTPEQLAVIRAANDERSRPLRSSGVMAPVAVDPPAEMTIISIEEWISHVAIRGWFAAPTPSTDVDLRLQAGSQWTIVDDAGRCHHGGDYGGGGGNSTRWVATAYLAPNLDPKWERLEVTVTSPTNGDNVTVQIQHQERR